jgi:hypothetical protein
MGNLDAFPLDNCDLPEGAAPYGSRPNRPTPTLTFPGIIIRQEDGSVAATGNFCLHRYARLLVGAGNAKRITCPYHHWTYQNTVSDVSANRIDSRV